MTLAIVNPAAAGGRGLAKWRRLEPRLAADLGALEVRRPATGSSSPPAGTAP